jgi:hypothetical protein
MIASQMLRRIVTLPRSLKSLLALITLLILLSAYLAIAVPSARKAAFLAVIYVSFIVAGIVRRNSMLWRALSWCAVIVAVYTANVLFWFAVYRNVHAHEVFQCIGILVVSVWTFVALQLRSTRAYFGLRCPYCLSFRVNCGFSGALAVCNVCLRSWRSRIGQE